MMNATIDPELESFARSVAARIDAHPIVAENSFTRNFATGGVTPTQLRLFTVQFSVFSHLFIEAQLRKCLNAPDLASYRAGKEILMNELGVTFARDGSVDGGRFRFRAAHFEWFADFASAVGLDWSQVGKRRLGTPSTLAFCDALMEWYGAEDESTAAGASYAIEHWAAAGFWKDLIAGLTRINETRGAPLPLGFWKWHDAIEDQHAAHTDDELTQAFSKPGFSQERFIAAGEAMLDAVAGFWQDLAKQTPSFID